MEELGKHLKNWAVVVLKRFKKKRNLIEQLKKLNQEDTKEMILASIIEVKLALNMEANEEGLLGAKSKI